MKRAIEDSFPIVEINRLAEPERNAFKPIYQMHKWFARRASSVFRAILLGCLKPVPLDKDGKPLKSGAEVIMDEFYKDHSLDADTNGKSIVDPFMGGGTTVIEALRLGCNVTGIDLNPVAWFVVKTEADPVDIEDLKTAFTRLETRKIDWSGKPLKETLLEQYKTKCPCCDSEDADIIYTFWIKSAVCTNINEPCRGKTQVPLFREYIITKKELSVGYWKDVQCPACKKTFDWEADPAAMVGNTKLMINSTEFSAGHGRSKVRWAYSEGDTVTCPWCSKEVKPHTAGKAKKDRKKIPLTVLLCPKCEEVWQYRGELSETLTCPICKHSYNPLLANVLDKGKFHCRSCGQKDSIIASIRALPGDKLLPIRPFAIEGYCSKCAEKQVPEEIDNSQLLFGNPTAKALKNDAHGCVLHKQGGKFFKRIDPMDLAKYQKAVEIWEKQKDKLPYPTQKVPVGEKTKSDLLGHHYFYWFQMFNPRQLLCLATLLKCIDEEKDQTLKELLLTAFFQVLRNQNMFCFYNPGRHEMEPLFSRHDFAPSKSPIENNVWGNVYGRGTFTSVINKVVRGKSFALKPYDMGQKENVHSEYRDPIKSRPILFAQSSKTIPLLDNSVDFVITDPPYADNVNYSELADFFYVWLRLILSKTYPHYAPDYTPKIEEIIENPTRGKTVEDFEKGLFDVFFESSRILKPDGLLAFTFHHVEGDAWEAVLSAICKAGMEIDSIYPIHSDAIKGGGMGAMIISYDLIHVCKKRVKVSGDKVSWAGIKQEIRRKAREEVRAIEAGRYGGGALNPEDVNIVLVGKCLEMYSRNFGNIVDHENNEFPLGKALAEIRMVVDQLVTKDNPLPSELSDIDTESYVYLTCLCDKKEIKADEVHKATRGIIETDALMKAGFMIKGRTGRGRTFEVKQPSERLTGLLEKFKQKDTPAQAGLFGPEEESIKNGKAVFADILHLLLGMAEAGENVVPWLERFKSQVPKIRTALEYLEKRNKTLAPHCRKTLDIMEVGPLFKVR